MMMYATPALSEDEVKQIASGVFRAVLGEKSIPTVTVEARESFDGDPSYYVLALIPDAAPRPDGDLSLRMQTELSGALIAKGEMRFPYLTVLRAADLGEPKSDASLDA